MKEYSNPNASGTEVRRKMASLIAVLRDSEEFYKGKLGRRYELLVSALSAYLAVIRTTIAETNYVMSTSSSCDYDAIRERVLFSCIVDLYKSTSDGIVVWYGATHIVSKFGKDLGPLRFGSRLRLDKEIQKTSVATVLLYANCEIPSTDYKWRQFYSDFPYDLKYIGEKVPFDISFMPTHGFGSPFDSAPEGVRPISYYADYIIIIRHREE
jgi:hypothetical protein